MLIIPRSLCAVAYTLEKSCVPFYDIAWLTSCLFHPIILYFRWLCSISSLKRVHRMLYFLINLFGIKCNLCKASQPQWSIFFIFSSPGPTTKDPVPEKQPDGLGHLVYGFIRSRYQTLLCYHPFFYSQMIFTWFVYDLALFLYIKYDVDNLSF